MAKLVPGRLRSRERLGFRSPDPSPKFFFLNASLSSDPTVYYKVSGVSEFFQTVLLVTSWGDSGVHGVRS